MTIGEKVPAFNWEYYQNNDFHKADINAYKGKWLVLLFYPADFTFVCPTELAQAQQFYAQFKKLNAELVSISTDTTFVHKAWHDQSPVIQNLEYPMAADPTATLCKLFGTFIEAEGLSQRATFMIDPDGVLKFYEMHDNSIGRNIEETLRKLKAAIYVREHNGEVCPANWHEGENTLTPGADLVGKI